MSNSLYYHSYYLTEELVVVSLADGNLDKREREDLAAKIYFSSNKGENIAKPTLRLKDKDNLKTNLRDIAGEKSWKIFNDLEISQDCDWLINPIEEWDDHQSFRDFKKFVSGLACVNDTSERKIKLIQDYVGSSMSESKHITVYS